MANYGMKKNTIKSHLLINDRLLGALLYFKDKEDRGCLKLSFPYEIANFKKGIDIPTTKPVLLESKDSITLDISYKFNDSLLEIKKIINKKVEPEFYPIPIPFSTALFILKIKDWHILDAIESPKQPLGLIYPNQCNSVAIIFSFLGIDGRPIAPKEYAKPIMGTIDLPESNLNKFCIGITEEKNYKEESNFIIVLPFKREQIQ